MTFEYQTKDQFIPTDKSKMKTSIDMMKSMINNETFGDVKLKSSDSQSFCCNKHILSARSNFFQTMFEQTDFKENLANEVEMKVDGKVLRQFIEFIYADQSNLATLNHDQQIAKIRPYIY